MRYWAIKTNNLITSVESYSHNSDVADRVEITETEFNTFMSSLPPPPPPFDWKAAWLAADTVAEKLGVLARRAGME